MFCCSCSSVINTNYLDLKREFQAIRPVSISQSRTRKENGVERAIDGDIKTNSAAEANLEDGEGVWVMLGFGETLLIHQVVIYYKFYTIWYDPTVYCAETINNFKGCVDSDTNVDVAVYKDDVVQKPCGTLELSKGLEHSDQIYYIECFAAGDMIKLSKTES